MTEPFQLSVNYKGSQQLFTAQLMLQGYTHRFKVLVNDQEIYFEPDEEGSYRAVQQPGQDMNKLATIDKNLLALIQEQITTILA